MLFSAINKSQCLKSQIQQQKVKSDNFELLLTVMAMVPVKGEKLTPELSELIKDGFLLIQKGYLDHPELNAICSDAILNLSQLTYDNFLITGDQIRSFDRAFVKESMNQKALAGLLTEDMKLYALDIVFKKK